MVKVKRKLDDVIGWAGLVSTTPSSIVEAIVWVERNLVENTGKYVVVLENNDNLAFYTSWAGLLTDFDVLP